MYGCIRYLIVNSLYFNNLASHKSAQRFVIIGGCDNDPAKCSPCILRVVHR